MLHDAQARLQGKRRGPRLDPLGGRAKLALLVASWRRRRLVLRRETGFHELLKVRKDLLAAQDLVDEVGVALVLVLDDVVEHLEAEDEVAGVLLVREQPLLVPEHLEQVACTERRGHAEGLDVGRDVGHGGHEAVVERVQLLRAVGHELVDDDVEEVSVVAREGREIHGELLRECRVQVHAEVPFPGEEEEDEGADVDEAELRRVLAPLVHEIQHRHHEFVDVAGAEDVREEVLVVVDQLPEQDQQLLEARDLLHRRREERVVRLVGVVEQAAEADEEEVEVLLR
mmetsp:Transcript_48882/g.116399  ORF Transcript_48882/g.116399 Transcript_48882/m.116399 type:complete len:285 (+) Transcript_48882:431-1285(+)